MSLLLASVAVLLVGVSFAHSYLGERYLLRRLLRKDNLPTLFGSDDFTKRTLRFAWHLTSVTWLAFAALVLLLNQAMVKRVDIAVVILVTFLLHFFVAFIGSKGKHLSWIAFLAISLLLTATILLYP